MEGPTLLRDVRLNGIVDALRDGRVRSTAELALQFGVSEMTLRRDLDHLGRRGLVRRVHGGARAAAGADPGYHRRAEENAAAKHRVGQAAAQLVTPGSCVYLDAGTTAREVGRAIAERARAEGLTARIVTHAVNIGAELAGIVGLSVHQLGGEVDPGTLAATGPALVTELRGLNFDLYFMGVTGIDPERGMTNSTPVGLEVKRAAMSRARETWVVADVSKWRQVSAYYIASMDAITGLVTDAAQNSRPHLEIERASLKLKVLSS
ncbi:transcriptional regulator, DeoR family (plasmid) [Methylobacterium nodulans ORS 2060]|uniref:Transcriptional regulator, DeoR family n=2 Tax=Methylobacterium nodulans TaxID=114616 RepID=B8IXE9_METNO|nr:transcriptional regulator, DeoR family [Methylobacterium nodulans ORS 2060]